MVNVLGGHKGQKTCGLQMTYGEHYKPVGLFSQMPALQSMLYLNVGRELQQPGIPCIPVRMTTFVCALITICAPVLITPVSSFVSSTQHLMFTHNNALWSTGDVDGSVPVSHLFQEVTLGAPQSTTGNQKG